MDRKVTLVELTQGHVQDYLAWKSTDEARRHLAPPTADEVAAEIEAGRHTPDDTEGTFIIINDEERPVGWVRYFRPDVIYDHYEITIVLGFPEDRRGGIGREAVRQVIERLFSRYGTERIQARTLTSNQAALAMCASLGFKEEGILRSAFRMEEGTEDVRILSLLKREWTGT